MTAHLRWALCLALCAVGVARAADSTNKTETPVDIPELAQLELDWNNAHLRGDADALDRLCADEIVVTVPHMKRMTKAGAVGFLRSGRMKFQRYQTQDARIRQYGETAVVSGRLQRTRVLDGESFDDDWQFTKVYARLGGRWQVVAFHVSESQ